MARTSVTVRKSSTVPPSAVVQLAGLSVAAVAGGLSLIASPRRVPVGVVAAALLGTIRPPNPEVLLAMGNSSLVEGDSGTANMTFQLVRGADPWGAIAFDYETQPGTATPGVDYTHVSGSGTIVSGQTVNINVPIIGDTSAEPDENFTLRIFNVAYL